MSHLQVMKGQNNWCVGTLIMWNKQLQWANTGWSFRFCWAHC